MVVFIPEMREALAKDAQDGDEKRKLSDNDLA